MKCSKARILLSASIDGELSTKEEQALEEHVSSCAVCADEKASLSGLNIVMSVWEDEEPSEWLAQSFAFRLQELSREQKPAPTRRPGWLIGTASAGLVTVLAIAGIVIHSQFTVPDTDLPVKPAVVASNNVSKPVTVAVNPPEVSAPAPVKNTVNKSYATAKSNKYKYNVRRSKTGRYTPRPVMVAYAKLDEQGSIDLSSRHAERMIMQKIALAQAAEGDTTSNVTDHLGEASMAMNETIEKVRGTLRVAADLMSVNQTPLDNTTIEADGGSIL
ncbi:MAG: zf-HC2 domain-containing protein [Armatimonadota bacterium]